MQGDQDEDRDIAKAIALSLASVDEEKETLKMAIAASLGKTVDQLTARDMLTAEIEQTSKRSREEASSTTSPPAAKRSQEGPPVDVFWDGIVKLTYVQGFVGPNYIRFEDIVQKSSLKKACVTAFVCSGDWIKEQFPESVNMCIVKHGRPPMRAQVRPTRLIIQPPMKDEKFGVFHPKLMLLVHDTRLRVVIGSANLERYDYNDLENVVFIQDFPRVAKPANQISDLPRFARDICDLLSRMHVPSSVANEMLHFDFSKAKAHIVASVSGVFEGKDEARQFGHSRLAQIVRDIGAAYPDGQVRVEMQTSSLGSLTNSYLNELYQSFCGIDPFENGNKRRQKTDQRPLIDMVYPSHETVATSRLGEQGAGTICLSSSAWRKPTFPKAVMCDAISHRQGTLMHSKYIIATHTEKDKSKDTIHGWVYCGSHNATVSAWGKLTLSKASQQPKMSISNWELGVVLPLYDDTDIPAPYLRPAPRYRDNQAAWTQDMEW